jgi:hypothetical protein
MKPTALGLFYNVFAFNLLELKQAYQAFLEINFAAGCHRTPAPMDFPLHFHD